MILDTQNNVLCLCNKEMQLMLQDTWVRGNPSGFPSGLWEQVLPTLLKINNSFHIDHIHKDTDA